MSRLYPLAAAALFLFTAGASAQESLSANTDPAAIPAEQQVLVCRYVETQGAMKTTMTLNCYAAGRFTLDQLYAARWRVAHYSTSVKTAVQHDFLLERR